MKRPQIPTTPATKALAAAGIEFSTHVYDHDPRTNGYGAEAAEKLGLEPQQVFKTLLADVSGTLVVCVVPVTGHLDLKAIAAVVGGGKATMADPALAERRTGYVVGGISPIGQKTPLRTVVDESAIVWEHIYVSGGRRGFDVGLAPDDLISITDGAYAAIAR